MGGGWLEGLCVSDAGPGCNRSQLFAYTSEVSLALLGWWPASAQTLWEMLGSALVGSLRPAPLIMLWPLSEGSQGCLIWELPALHVLLCGRSRWPLEGWVSLSGLSPSQSISPPASSPLGWIRICPCVQGQSCHGRPLAWEGFGLSGVWWVFTQVVSCGHKVCPHSAWALT